MQGLTGLSLKRQGRNEPPCAELEPEPILAIHTLRTWLLGHHLSCQKEEKPLEECVGPAEIPGEKAESKENRYAIGMKGLTEWLQKDMDRSSVGGGTLCSTCMAWNRAGKE
ncbi:hypothetical protein BTVI_38890 [Pitangus sulphuratus]|nr:hypothetical protein BTVI_38890 [Pitangus sulphuratus]